MVPANTRSLAFVPLRGIRFRNETLDFDPFQREWALLSLRQVDALKEYYSHTGSVPGNIDQIKDRLSPDAFLVLRCFDPSAPALRAVYQRAEGLLGVICITTLLASEDPAGTRQYGPRPIYWTRTKEYCELPLVIDSERGRSVGHSSEFAWFSPDDLGMNELMSIEQVHNLLATGPSLVPAVLGNLGLTTKWQICLTDGARAIHAGFQATSAGQLIANMVSAAEVLVTLNGREPQRKRFSRIKVLTGPAYWTRVEQILAARHEYVHEAKQPPTGNLALGALGLAVHTWATLHEMFEAGQDLDQVLGTLDALASADPPKHRTTNDLTPGEMSSLNARYSGIPRGPLRRLYWINQRLTDIDPNEYYERYAIFDDGFCQHCRHPLKPEHITRRTPEIVVFRCPECTADVEALLPFANHR
jgi:hypothetical protein